MKMKQLSVWMMFTLLFAILSGAEVIHMIYLWVTGETPNVIGFIAEILLFVVAAFFCWGREDKRRQEEKRAGPLITEEQEKKMKEAPRHKEPIVICPEGKPYLIIGIVFYVFFLGGVTWMLLDFTWLHFFIALFLGSVCIFDIYKYMKIKNDLSIQEAREELMKRKKAARREALQHRRAEEEKKRQQEAQKQQEAQNQENAQTEEQE